MTEKRRRSKNIRECRGCVYENKLPSQKPCCWCLELKRNGYYTAKTQSWHQYFCDQCVHYQRPTHEQVCKVCRAAGRPIQFAAKREAAGSGAGGGGADAQHDPVAHPSHYTKPGTIENWDGQELMLTETEFTGACKSHIFKYMFRAGRKDDLVLDLKKARAWLDRWIRFAEGERVVFTKGRKSTK